MSRSPIACAFAIRPPSTRSSVASAAAQHTGIPAERRAVRALPPLHHLIARDDRADRHPRAQPLRREQHVGLHALVLAREHLPCASNAALHLVDHEQDAVAIAELAQARSGTRAAVRRTRLRPESARRRSPRRLSGALGERTARSRSTARSPVCTPAGRGNAGSDSGSRTGRGRPRAAWARSPRAASPCSMSDSSRHTCGHETRRRTR